MPTSAFWGTSDRSDLVPRQPLGWASPQPSAGSNRQRRRPTFLRRHAAWQALSPRPAEPAFEGHGGQQSAWPFHQRFEAKPEHDENYSYPPLHTTHQKFSNCTTTCTTRQDFPTPEEYCSTKGECSKPMRKRPQGLRPTRLNGTRARSTYRLGHVSSIRADARSGA